MTPSDTPVHAGHLVESREELERIVREARVVAVFGMQDEAHADRPAFTVPAAQARWGMTIIPVNPGITSSLGTRAYPNLASVPDRFDMVQVFRRSEAIPEVAEQLLALPPERRPDVVWLQTGIRNDPEARRLAAAGMRVVQDECLGVLASRFRR